MDIVLPFVFCLVFGIGLTVALTRSLPPGEARWIQGVVIIALVLRLAAAALFAAVPETRMFHEDATGYEQVGMHIADGWAGRTPPYPFMTELPNRGYFYTCAAIYYVFSGMPAAPSFVNAIIGALTVLFVYQLARRLFHPLVGRLAARLTAYTPSMILWSSVALKDPIMSFLVILTLDACVKLKRGFSLGSVLGVTIPLVLMQPIRFYMIYFLGFAVVISLLAERGGRLLTGVPKQLLIGGTVVALLALVGFAGSAQQNAEFLTFEHVSAFRHGMATTANSGFDAEVDVSTPARALAYLPIGVATLLLSPFPWQFTSLRASFAAPEMLVWWALLPSLIGGIVFAMRRRFAEASPLILFASALTGAYALLQGNVGAAFRQRSQIFVVLFILAALGWYRRKCRRAGIDETLLLQPAG
jgi:4-amino-4-deoxy-L-arabinose transferase-like glycosyltransferase